MDKHLELRTHDSSVTSILTTIVIIQNKTYCCNVTCLLKDFFETHTHTHIYIEDKQ